MARRRRLGSPGQARLAGVLLGALALSAGSAVLGLAVNHISPRGIPLLPSPANQQAGDELGLPLPAGIGGVDNDEARQALDDPSALFLDARSPQEYNEGHLPGALNLPAYEFDDHFFEVMEPIEEASRIIVYCDGDECSDSIAVAERLVEFGFSEVYVFEGGWRSWVESERARGEAHP
jgi:rhodanese-related sulfurtransferase